MFTRDEININPQLETEEIVNKMKIDILQKFKKRGAVIGISGGIDSSVVLALCTRALGAERVLGVVMPEKDSSPDNYIMLEKLIKKFKVNYIIEDMTPVLYGFEAYQRRDEAIQQIFPEYHGGYKAKIGLSQNLLEQDTLNLFHLTIISPDGEEKSARLPLSEYLQIVAASNFKQRSRMCMLYYHAERLNYAVVGTANKNEHDLGFFVKYGDGGIDVLPIVHLFKTQIFQLAEYLEIPKEIRLRVPTTDTYSAEQSQEEFFFRISFDLLDRIWHGWGNGVPVEEIASVLDLRVDQVNNVINDINRKMAATAYLRTYPLRK